MAGVDGTEPARVAGGGLSRLLLGAMTAGGLAVLAWLFAVVVGAGTASADPAPTAATTAGKTTGKAGKATAKPAQHAGLLGLVGGLTNSLTGTVGQLTGTVGQLTGTVGQLTGAIGQLTGAVLNSTSPVVAPVVSPTPEPPGRTRLDPAPVPVRSPVRALAPAPRPEPAVRPKPIARPAAPVTITPHRRAPVPTPRPVLVQRRIDPGATDRAHPSAPDPQPGKVPSAPAAPAVPTGTVSSWHDGHGQARGGHGVLPCPAILEPPAEAFTTRARGSDTGSAVAGLPTAAPD